MTEPVAVPFWLLLLILAFAAITFASHFLFPSVRWFFRKRAERALAQLNARLDRPIEWFKLARRQDMMLGMATGKSRRGVERLLARRCWQNHFASVQTADDHPSKPAPDMILACMEETGIGRGETVMIGVSATS